MPLPSVFDYYSDTKLSNSDYDQAVIWLIVITDLLVSVVVSFTAAALDSLFISKTADPRIAKQGFRELVLLS